MLPCDVVFRIIVVKNEANEAQSSCCVKRLALIQLEGAADIDWVVICEN